MNTSIQTSKLAFKFAQAALSAFGFATTIVHANIREVSVDQVFVPSYGFDDNDNVVVTLKGKLPNLCYELVDTQLQTRENQNIQIRQFAKLRPIADCKNGGRDLPSYLNWPVTFTKDLSLGVLGAATYTLLYSNEQSRRFHVEKAPTEESVDNVLYAPITRAFIPELMYETRNGQVVLSGVLEQSCYRLQDKDIQVERVGDVVVVLPKLTLDTPLECVASPRPIQKVVMIGKLTAGNYLLHVRSLGGQSISSAFQVIPQVNDNDGELGN